MRLIFAGTPAFAVPALRSLAGIHDVAAVLTQPDRPSGRGLKLTPSPVALAAESLGLPIRKFTSLREPQAQQELAGLDADAMVVAAYGLILPQAVLDIPRHGCINIHASLLPRWRGAAPIQRAILAGDARTGISIMQMEAGLDTGPVLLERELAIPPRATTGELTDALAQLGALAIVEALSRLSSLTARAQDATRATYAAKIGKHEARIDWQRPAGEIDRMVRAFNPAPGAEAELEGERVKIWSAEPTADRGPPGQILRAEGGELRVACGEGGLRLLILQRPGARRLEAAEFLRGRRVQARPA